MEHTLGAEDCAFLGYAWHGLNPCFSGTYSRSTKKQQKRMDIRCLNPCFSGTYSRRRIQKWADAQCREVLILVLVEHTLGALHCRTFVVFLKAS